MKTVIATDVALLKFNDKYYCAPQVSTIFRRYHNNFGRLTVCGRIARTGEAPDSYEDVTDIIDGVICIASLEKTMVGLYDKTIRQIVKESEFVICRCPGIISHRVAAIAKRCGKPYLAESMGCAWDAYWNHSIAGKIIAPYMFWKMRSAIYHADYALYVTNEFLQKRYPCKNESVGVSNVLIKDVDPAVLEKRLEKIAEWSGSEIKLMTTAAVDVKYKGQEYVIRAIPAINKAGYKVKYYLAGGGSQDYLGSVAKKYGVSDQVVFLGRLTLEEVLKKLDEIDIYIQPSLQEGLPRSVIEAMSRACPVVGARTAGIPELISPECVVRRKSANDIAQTIVRIVDADKMPELAKKNFEESKGYIEEILDSKRSEYFIEIKSSMFAGE